MEALHEPLSWVRLISLATNDRPSGRVRIWPSGGAPGTIERMETAPKRRKWIQPEMETLSPDRDAPRIIQLYLSSVLPRSAMLNNLIYTIGLVRLCASREQAIPVHRGGRGKVYSRGDQRADETNFHLFMWLDRDLSSPQVQQSLSHVKHVHDLIARKWPMRQEAFLHALASFTLFVDNFQTRVLGTSPLGERERSALLHQFRGIGCALGIENVPPTWREMQAYLDAYEQSDNVGWSTEGAAVAEALIQQFVARWLPTPAHQLGRWMIVSLLEPHIITALRLKRPPAIVAALVRRLARFGLFLKRRALPDPKEPLRLSTITTSHPKSAAPRCPMGH